MPCAVNLANPCARRILESRLLQLPKRILNTHSVSTDKHSFFLQQTEATPEIHRWSQCREELAVGCPSTTDTSTHDPDTSGSGDIIEEGQKDCKSLSSSKNVFYTGQGAAPIKSHQVLFIYTCVCMYVGSM